jgi:4-diphosphocytidyl-2-C-methyl-D-erythritol kinase
MNVDAYTKLTLSLHIAGVRADGYHELDALMVTVTEPHDSLVLESAAETSLVVAGEFASGVPADRTNLAWRAADACAASVAITLRKGIPPGAGLGGGSADAAALLVARGSDAAVGASLGADVPFCMHGGPARVSGIGDVVEPVALAAKFVVIASPHFGCATVDVYRAWDELGGPRDPVNDLEPAAHHVEPRLVSFKHTVEDAAGARAILAGSGASYAVVFDDAADAEAARRRVAESVNGWVWLGTTRGPGRGPRP